MYNITISFIFYLSLGDFQISECNRLQICVYNNLHLELRTLLLFSCIYLFNSRERAWLKNSWWLKLSNMCSKLEWEMKIMLFLNYINMLSSSLKNKKMHKLICDLYNTYVSKYLNADVVYYSIRFFIQQLYYFVLITKLR